MKYSLWFPTHSVEPGSFRSWFPFLCQPAYRLDKERQAIVTRAIRELCLDRGWRLAEIEPREWEVAAVVETAHKPERVVHDFKIAASRALASLDGEGPQRKRFDRRARIRQLSQASAASA
ncbi:MAG: hypothetical protein K2X03_19550 [Bryobacteraceae bacterium]|nr:hypothetical protein [Bryobacteraceae bacterium]